MLVGFFVVDVVSLYRELFAVADIYLSIVIMTSIGPIPNRDPDVASCSTCRCYLGVPSDVLHVLRNNINLGCSDR